MKTATDFLIVGAGIAGASVAAVLASRHRVLIVEREARAGYHSTGRSAAIFTETYGGDVVRALTGASRSFFESPPIGFAASPLLTPRGVLYIARPDQGESLEDLLQRAGVADRMTRLSRGAAVARIPILREIYSGEALYESAAADIDVHELHGGFLRQARALGAELRLDCDVLALTRAPSGWIVDTSSGEIAASTVINAAGAWADQIGAMAGVRPIGLQPKRRTVLLVDPPVDLTVNPWPLTVDIDGQFYLKPDAGLLLLSPADSTPSPPCDAQAEEHDVAIAVERVEQATVLDIKKIRHKWAGLRSSVRDDIPVVGPDPEIPGFFWLAGQGGYGIQTAPAMARIAAAMICGATAPAAVDDCGIDIAAMSPERLHRTAAILTPPAG